MANAPFPDVGNQDSLAQLRIIVGEISQLLNWLFQGNIDSLNVRKLTADLIKAGTLLANLVTIMSNLNDGAYIRIDGNGMVINDGTNDTFTVDIDGFVTLTGALFQTSAASYPRVTIDPATTLFKAEQSASNRLEIAASHASSSPAMMIYQGGSPKLQIQEIGGADVLIATLGGDDLQLSANGDLYLNGTNTRLNPSTDLTINGIPGWTGTYNDGTNTITVVKGIITNVV
jgi:hypothetical protein